MNATTTYCIEAVTVTTYNAAAITAVICYSYTSAYYTSDGYV